MSKTDVFEDRASNPFDLEVPILLEDSVVRATLENRRTTSLLAQEQYHYLLGTSTVKPLLLHVPGYLPEEGTSSITQVIAKPRLIEPDRYTFYYKSLFFSKAHINFVGEHPKFGPVIVSIEAPGEGVLQSRCLVKTKFEDLWAFIPSTAYPKHVHKEVKAALENAKSCNPDFVLASVKLQEVKNPNTPHELARMETLLVPSAYKFGVLYSADGQVTESDMFCNEHGSAEFDEFLLFLGEKVTLRCWSGYRGGLDIQSTHSIFTKYEGFSIMFHTSTLLPYHPNDRQQLERKRHIGNDVVVLIFKDSDSQPFDPLCITSEFNHIFVVITPDREKKGTWYRLAVSTRDGSKPCEPQLPSSSTFEKNEIFRHFLLTKTMHAPAFKERMERVKGQQMQSVVQSALKAKK